MKTFTKNQAKAGEIYMYEVLQKISGKYNRSLVRLKLPKALKINYKDSSLLLPFYNGQTFNALWNEATGGSLLKLDLSKEVAEIIRDLSQIDISPVLNHPKLKRLNNVWYNHAKYQRDFTKLMKIFTRAKLITKSEALKATRLLKAKFTSPLILNNGDFYPRNFIKLPNKKII